MRSVSRPGQGDLTAQAKIRNAAIAHFARDGFQKAKLRAIAAEAGVSPGLIFHHFGSKEGLRAACDEHVLQNVTARAHTASPTGMHELLAIYLNDPEQYQFQAQYVARAIQEDTPAAETLAETMVAESEAIFTAGAAHGIMRQSPDPRALAVLTIVLSLGVLNLPPSLTRALGHEKFEPEVLRRLGRPALELYTNGLYTDDTIAKAAADAWASTDPPPE